MTSELGGGIDCIQELKDCGMAINAASKQATTEQNAIAPA